VSQCRLRFVDRCVVKDFLLSEVFTPFAAVVDHHVAEGIDRYYSCGSYCSQEQELALALRTIISIRKGAEFQCQKGMGRGEKWTGELSVEGGRRGGKKEEWEKGEGRSGIPVIPIKLNAVNRCALSAQTRPRTMSLSKPETFASLARAAASLNRRTFCCGISPSGASVRLGNGGAVDGEDGGVGLEGLGECFAEACGVVGVKRVASVADFGIFYDYPKFGNCVESGIGLGEGVVVVRVTFDFGGNFF
jgi:hypothetical protein